MTQDNNRNPVARSVPRSERFGVNFYWLLNLRWVAVVGQMLTILFVVFVLNISVDVAPLVVILGVTLLSNVVLWIWLRGGGPVDNISDQDSTSECGESSEQITLPIANGNSVLGLVMVLDMLSLTTLLYTTGGPNNPFNLFFFVNLSLSAVILSRSWAWALNLLTIICFALLIYSHIPIPELGGDFFHEFDSSGFHPMQSVRSTGQVSIAQIGAIVAFALCASVIVYFMTRLTDELGMQERDLRYAQAKHAQSEKLEALGTLAAGTAHELATPLSTIAIIASELESQVEQTGASSEIVEDVHLIRSELDRCRKILDQLSADAGLTSGESLSDTTVTQVIEEVLNGLPTLTGLPNESTVEVEISEDAGRSNMRVPLGVLAQTIRGLVKNGVDATSTSPNQAGLARNVGGATKGILKPVRLLVSRDQQQIDIRIQDFGTGMSEEELRRIGEPFFSTKPVGQGMGLGVFLARDVIEKLGGKLNYESSPGQGTIVRILLNLNET